MNLKKLACALGVGLGLAVAAGPAQSMPPLWNFEDDDIDFALDSSFNLKAPGSGHTINVNDILVSAFEMPTFTIDGNNAIPAGKELTGISAIQLKTKDANGDGVNIDWEFQPVAGGVDAVLNAILGPGSAAARLDTNAGTGSMIAMFLNDKGVGTDRDLELNKAVNPATNCNDLVDCVDQATRGSLLQVDGFKGDLDEFWQAFVVPAGDNIDTVAGLNFNTIVASVNFGLSNFFNKFNTVDDQPVYFQDLSGNLCEGVVLGSYGSHDGCVQLLGAATITGGSGLSNGAFAHSDADASKYVLNRLPWPWLGQGF